MGAYRYFTWAFIVTALGLAGGAWLGWSMHGNFEGMATIFLICCVLAVLEISLSFDNAIVNAKILKDMTPVWQQRFLTWGIIIAVFGMRIIFPLAIVAIAAWIDPIAAMKLAISQPEEYSRIMIEAHVGIAAFGGAFLFMVGLKYFFDAEKDVHWVVFLEKHLSRFASIQGIEIGIVLATMLIVSAYLPSEDAITFFKSGLYGLLTFLAVEGLGHFLDASQEQVDAVHKAGLGSFLYLEVLDASFSFDGVIGAFALSNNLFIIAIGLGIGAMYVRSMTIMLVKQGTLSQYRYLEHGAFYAILVLAVVMFIQTLVHVPEVVTGLLGASLIGISFWHSIVHKRNNPVAAE